MFLRGLVNFSNHSIKTISAKASSVISILIMIRIIGLPPLPGFFFKLDIVVSIISFDLWLLRASFISGSAAILLAYLRVAIIGGIAFSRLSLAPSSRNIALGVLPSFIISRLLMI